MSVELLDSEAYIIHYNPNGGVGMMLDQVVKLGSTTTLRPNQFSLDDNRFGGWNTRADGTGTSYPNNYAITSDLGSDGDIIALYAQWIPSDAFYVSFDANGGSGIMNDQKFIIGDTPKSLSPNGFTRTNYEFRGWNTAPDGTGTHYDDLEAVSDLSNVNNDIVTLYAEWWKIQYSHTGSYVFDGTINTFIDTGVNVFSSTNINKDFEIRFTYNSVDSDIFTYTPKQPTIFNVKDESNNQYPGFNVRFNNNNTTLITPTYRWGQSSSQSLTAIATSNAPIDFIYRRKNGVVTVQYSYEGFISQEYTVVDQDSWTLNRPFSTNVAFGGYFDGSNQPGRFFKGTLSDMIILMDD